MVEKEKEKEDLNSPYYCLPNNPSTERGFALKFDINKELGWIAYGSSNLVVMRELKDFG